MFVADPFCGGDRNLDELCELDRVYPPGTEPVEAR